MSLPTPQPPKTSKLKSTNGTNSTENKELSSADVSAILKACGEARVAILQFGDLHVWFDSPVTREALNPAPFLPIVPEAAISDTQKKQAERALVQAELAQKADETAELILADPKRFEELLLKGDLEEDGQSGQDEEA